MKALTLAALTLVLLPLSTPDVAHAACTGRQVNDGICGNRELMALRQAGDAKLKGIAAAADPLTALLMARMFRECGLPEHVYQVTTGDGATGEALIDEVDCIMFTGSTATGRKVMERAARTLTPVSLLERGTSYKDKVAKGIPADLGLFSYPVLAAPSQTPVAESDPTPPAPAAPATPPAAAAPAIGKPTMEISAPKNVSHVSCNIAQPDYPALSKRRRETGVASVRFVIGLDGKLESIELAKSSGFSRLDDAAVAAVHASACKPYLENGQPIRAAYTQPYDFNLND